MGLFTSKKNPCVICGGATPRIFARMVEDRPLCGDCSGRIDIEPCLQENLTVQSLKEHLAFLDKNQVLRDNFIISKKLDFGFFGEKIIFDLENKLFCMSGEPDKMVFEGSLLKSFTISEDYTPLFQGSQEGLKRYNSSVPDRVADLIPRIEMIRLTERMNNRLDKGADNKDTYRPRVDIPKPFEKFRIELKLDHPYWHTIEFSVSGPDFNNSRPDANDYLREYYEDASGMEELASALMAIAFEGAGEIAAGADNPANPAASAAVDSIEEIRRYKALVEEGIITEEEFTAKKRQLLGI